MPQDPQASQQPQIPGSDVLLDTLRRSRVTDDQKQQIWDAYHTPGDEKAFIGAMRGLPVGDDVRQNLYDMRYKGWKNQGNTPQAPQGHAGTVASLDTQAPAKGDVRPSEQDIQNDRIAKTNQEISSFYGRMIPDAAVPYLSAINKYAIRPFDKMHEVGADVTGTAAQVVAMHAGITGQTGQGVARGIGELIGGTVADPRMWPFALEGAAKSALSELAARGFSSQMLLQAATSSPAIRDAIKSGDHFEAGRLITSAVGSGALGLLGVKGENTKSTAAEQVKTATDKIAAPDSNGPKDNPVQNGPARTSTPMGPISQGGQQLQLDFTTKAPIEATAPQNTATNATKVGSAPAVDRQALLVAPAIQNRTSGPAFNFKDQAGLAQEAIYDLKQGEHPGLGGTSFTFTTGPFKDRTVGQLLNTIGRTAEGKQMIAEEMQRHVDEANPSAEPPSLIAPKPQDFVGKDAPIGLHRFPKAAIEGMPQGGTVGLGPVDLAPKPSADMPKMSFETGRDGVKYAIDSKPGPLGEVRVSIPNRIAPDEIPQYAAEKLAEQRKMHEAKAAGGNAQDAVPVAPYKPTSFELPDAVGKAHDLMADYSRQADLAQNDAHAAELNGKRAQLEDITNSLVQKHVDALDTDQVRQLRDKSLTDATKLDAQSKAIRDLTESTIKNRGLKQDLTDLKSNGGPVRKMEINPETGERGTVKPEDILGRSGRSILHEMEGHVPTNDFNKVDVQAKPDGVSAEEWADHVGKLQDERLGLKKNITEAVRMASEKGMSLDDVMNAGLSDHVSRLKEIDGLLSKYSEPAKLGRTKNIPAEVDENGAIKAPEAIKSWSIERARLALGSLGKKNMMPTDEEFFQHADMRADKAQSLRKVADIADKSLIARKEVGQGGFAGERQLHGKVEPATLRKELQIPDDEKLVKQAASMGHFGRAISMELPAGVAAWISPDGKFAVDTGQVSHFRIAQDMLRDSANRGNPEDIMKGLGWIRKATPLNFEVHNLTSKALNVIENDLIAHGRLGRSTFIDTITPRGTFATLEVPNGWDEKFSSLEKAINAEKARTDYKGKLMGWNDEAGVLRGGTAKLGTAATGGIAGAVVGAHLGGPAGAVIGGAIGWGAGFMTPELAAQARPLFAQLKAMRPTLASFNIPVRDWLMGPKQADPVNPDMKTILDAQQRDLRGPVKGFLSRITQFPGNVQNALFDKFVFINDRPGAMSNFLMKFDERGRAFRDLRGKLDVDNSPYVSAWLAAGGGGGMAEAHLLDYKRMYTEAQSKGLINNLNEYLNLKGYQRVYDVAQERIAEHDQNIQRYQQALQQPNLPVEVEAGIKKALRDAKGDRQDVIDKLTSKTMVPAPYDPPKIAADMQNLQATLGPKFQDVQQLAGRVFGLNRKVLDMVHDAGIVGDSDYQKYTARGDEYIPMHRILEQVLDGTANTGGKGTPLYLRQQQVIKALMGSDRINRDPVVASADANLEAMREVMRNGVIKDYLKLAAADPQGVGSYFKQVKPGYKAQPGEGIVGVYDGGQQHSFAAPSWLSESLKNVSPASVDMIGKGPMQYFSQILRKGATVGNLAWSVPNAIRHLGEMAIMSEAGLKSIPTLPRDVTGMMRDWTKSVYGSITHDPVWQEYMRSGAAYSTLQRMIQPEDHLDLNALGFKGKVAHGRVIDVVGDFNAAIEDATKMTTYRRLREAGYSEKNAAWETRRYGGGPDFARQGNMTPAINLASMFFNAHLQYVTRVFARAAENPARIAVALGAITMMAMGLNQHNYQQKFANGDQMMRKVPYTDRENNFVVLTGDTYQSTTGATLPVYYKIPKPSFVKFLYNPIENMLNKVAGHEDRSGTQLGLQAIGNLSPGQMDLQEGQIGKSVARGAVSSLNPVIRTPLEEAMNYKTTGVGSPIVPTREQSIDSQFQYGPNTSETAKRIGEGGVRGAVAGGAEGTSIGYLLGGPKGAAVGGALGAVGGSFGISPRRAEHVIDTTTAGVGRMATGFVDPFLAGVKQTHMEGPEKLANTPIAGPIAARFISTSVDQQEQALTQEFYQRAQEAQMPMQTLQFLTKNHPEQIPSYLQAHKDELWKANVSQQMTGRLGQITNAQRQIEQNDTMEPAAKQEALKNLHAVKMQVLNVFTKVMRPSPQVPQASAYPGQGQGAPH